MNAPTIIVLTVLAVLVVAAVVKLHNDKKNGKGCNGDCASCMQSCHRK